MTDDDETELIRLRAEVLRIGHDLSMLRGRCRDGEYQPSALTPSRSHG